MPVMLSNHVREASRHAASMGTTTKDSVLAPLLCSPAFPIVTVTSTSTATATAATTAATAAAAAMERK